MYHDYDEKTHQTESCDYYYCNLDNTAQLRVLLKQTN